MLRGIRNPTKASAYVCMKIDEPWNPLNTDVTVY